MIKHPKLIPCDIIIYPKFRSNLLQIHYSISDCNYTFDVFIIYKEVSEFFYEIRHVLLHDIFKGNCVRTILRQIIPDPDRSYRKVLGLYEILPVKYRYLNTSRAYIQKRPVLDAILRHARFCSVGLVIHKSLFRIAEHNHFYSSMLFYTFKNHNRIFGFSDSRRCIRSVIADIILLHLSLETIEDITHLHYGLLCYLAAIIRITSQLYCTIHIVQLPGTFFRCDLVYLHRQLI